MNANPSNEVSDRQEEAELLALLDREIDYVYQQSRRRGWTPWALLTALATLLWGVASRFERVTSPGIVLQSAVFAVMLIDVLRRGRLVLDPSRSSDEEGRVHVSSDILNVERPALALELIYAGVLLWGLQEYSTGLASWARVTGIVWASLTGLWALVGLLYSAWAFPIPVGVSLPTPARLLIQCGVVLLPALGAWGFGRAVFGHGAEDIRVGLLLGSAAVILLEVARQPDAPPLLSELVEIRRAVSLGSLSPAEGVESATLILRGLKLEDYVQQAASRMLRAMESLRAAVADFGPVVQELNRQTDLIERKAAREEQDWSRLISQWERKGEEVDARFRDAMSWERKFAKRLQLAAGVSRLWSLPYEGSELMAQIQPRADAVTSAYKDVVQRYRVALARFEQAAQAAGLVR